MKPESLLPYLLQPAIEPYPDESIPHFKPYFFKISFNIILKSISSTNQGKSCFL
jgi:hypothetical protein